MTTKEKYQRLIEMAGFKNYRQFCLKFNISSSMFSRVINEKLGISHAFAYKAHKALEECNIGCSIEYLLGVSNDPPKIIYRKSNVDFQEIANDTFELQQEAICFKKNKNSVLIRATDDALEPLISLSDYVGGIMLQTNYNEHLDRLCIINYNSILGDGLTSTRLLKPGFTEEKFNLIAYNMISKLSEPNIYNVSLNWIAPVIWIRKVF